MRNYHSVSLLPICWKILKRLVINEMFQFFIKNILISSSQSCFKPGNSSISQLLFITHEIYSSFDGGVKVRSVFLDNSKDWNMSMLDYLKVSYLVHSFILLLIWQKRFHMTQGFFQMKHLCSLLHMNSNFCK